MALTVASRHLRGQEHFPELCSVLAAGPIRRSQLMVIGCRDDGHR